MLRQRFHATPWEDPSSLTFQSIGGKLSTTQPYGSCAAHESFGDRLRSTASSFMRQAVEDTLAAHPDVKLKLEHASELYEHISSPVKAAVFLPGVWAKWADAVEGVVDAVQDRSLLQLCLLARPSERAAGQPP